MGAPATRGDGPDRPEWLDQSIAGRRRFALWAREASRGSVAGTGADAAPTLGRGPDGGAGLDSRKPASRRGQRLAKRPTAPVSRPGSYRRRAVVGRRPGPGRTLARRGQRPL